MSRRVSRFVVPIVYHQVRGLSYYHVYVFVFLRAYRRRVRMVQGRRSYFYLFGMLQVDLFCDRRLVSYVRCLLLSAYSLVRYKGNGLFVRFLVRSVHAAIAVACYVSRSLVLLVGGRVIGSPDVGSRYYQGLAGFFAFLRSILSFYGGAVCVPTWDAIFIVRSV